MPGGNVMAKGDIVIVSCMADLHADEMVLQLQEMGHEPIRLNTDDIPLNTTMSFYLPCNQSTWQSKITIQSSGRAIDLDMENVRSIWWRRPLNYFGLPPELSEQEREFARAEIDHTLRGLWSLLDCYWISYPEHIRQASWKMSQLQRATQCGFEVPHSCLTSDPDEVSAFYDMCNGRMIFKVLTDPFLGAPIVAEKHPGQPLPEARETKTILITEKELEQLDSVRLVPCLFQEYIPKQTELRVTIIGDELFVAEIDSQASEGTKVDWRNWSAGGLKIPYRKASLPLDVAESCMALVRSYQLNFSAIDLILTPDGRYVFIENNPNGQFMWIEKLVPELKMTEALASCLIRGKNG
jgi:glutathione synthase/RimK-type ligase-like ATP-grasp enzyme